MKTSLVTTAVALATLMTAANARSVAAFDLTGTWQGKYSCAEYNGTKSKAGNKNSVLLITQTGNTLAMTLNGTFRYNGAAIADVKKPEEKGEAVFSQCGTDNVPLAGAQGEIIRATVKTKTGSPKATLRAVSIFEDPATLDGTCKYTFKRTDTLDPSVSGCL